MNDVIQKHIDALHATHALLGAQLHALQHAAQIAETPRLAQTLELPARCAGIAAQHCAVQTPDAMKSSGNLAQHGAWICLGCGFEGDAVAGVT